MRIAAIMPCRGRAEQTVRNVRRLLATAGMRHAIDWQLYCVVAGDDDRELAMELSQLCLVHAVDAERLTYWQALAYATERTDATHLIGLANDLLPGRDWLARAVDAYRATFGPNAGMIGLNDGIHAVDHSPHFLIDRGLLESLGGWPVWYQHNYGDTELVVRATERGMYAKAPWAVLYHDHHLTGGAHDGVYAEGDATADVDRQLFDQRRRQGWPAVGSR